MSKNKHTKNKWKNPITKCDCFYCMGSGVERWQKLKYRHKPKHRNQLNDYRPEPEP